ncbi:MAG: LGFP repeat-containing protein [Nitriliruptorales bacterium]
MRHISAVSRPSRRRPFASRLVHRVARSVGGRRLDRRSFLYRTAIVGTALLASPRTFIFRPVSAYASVCGAEASCGGSWTAMCCTVNGGANTCPPGSFAAGWWKVDGSEFCLGGPRYYIDCNREPTARCSCHCADGACDRRRVCCNRFRYGQCNTHIPGITEVVCRVILCTPPWEWDPACSTTARTEPATATHSSTCLPGPGSSHVAIRYQDLGMVGSPLGRPIGAEEAGARGGLLRRYEHGYILWLASLGAHVLLGPVAGRYRALGLEDGTLGYPRTDHRPVERTRGEVVVLERGRIYWSPGTGAHAVLGPVHDAYLSSGGPVGSGLGFPIGSLEVLGSTQLQTFEDGVLVWSEEHGAHVLRGAIADRYRAAGGPSSPWGVPVEDQRAVGDGRGEVVALTEGRLWWSPATGAHAVQGAVLDRYVEEGGPDGPLGYPTTDTFTTRSGQRRSSFERGAITADPATGETTVVMRRETRDASEL